MTAVQWFVSKCFDCKITVLNLDSSPSGTPPSSAGGSPSQTPDPFAQMRSVVLGKGKAVVHPHLGFQLTIPSSPPATFPALPQGREEVEAYLQSLHGLRLNTMAETFRLGTLVLRQQAEIEALSRKQAASPQEVANLKRTIALGKAALGDRERARSELAKKVLELETLLAKEQSAKEETERDSKQRLADLEVQIASFQTKEKEDARARAEAEAALKAAEDKALAAEAALKVAEDKARAAEARVEAAKEEGAAACKASSAFENDALERFQADIKESYCEIISEITQIDSDFPFDKCPELADWARYFFNTGARLRRRRWQQAM